MFDFETTLSGIEYKIRKLVDENNGLKAEIARLTESNEELIENIKKLEESMDAVQLELSKTQKTQKLQMAYDNTATDNTGNMLNIEE